MYNNKWILVSSISTILGILSGGCYLFFAEHSLLLTDRTLTLNAFWSSFMVWAFVVMFICALCCNVMAFLALEQSPGSWGNALLQRSDPLQRQQQFLTEAERFLLRDGRWQPQSASFSTDYRCLTGATDTLVYVQLTLHPVDINQIRAMFQQMLAADFNQGLVISYNGFTNQACIFAQEAKISLLDSRSLKKQQKRLRAQQFALIKV
ncbi:restriction endonuclease [Arsukibacterium sp.]|uniref:restriction endonuclease n=1 Tax=Arsukibacterium sp. TaxID=1977258 RepID=UPI002FDAFDD5